MAEAKTGPLTGITAGVLVPDGVSFLSNPGKKNEAGETLVPALTPPQPLKNNGSARTDIASHKDFQFNLTRVL
ncbi:MAG TPA: hypothetical protein VGY98_13410 [Verrucomicrobiae bacterium]|nr:hypothetical protein [Verrucomicrobiae bacterium]